MFIFISRDPFRSIYKRELISQEVDKDFNISHLFHAMTENGVIDTTSVENARLKHTSLIYNNGYLHVHKFLVFNFILCVYGKLF